jgi:hypothetical protein
MTRDDIIKLAREAGMAFQPGLGVAMADEQKLERFAALVAAAEREACAKEAENRTLLDDSNARRIGYYTARDSIASCIRARGQE